jgi:hypothetical protein
VPLLYASRENRPSAVGKGLERKVRLTVGGRLMLAALVATGCVRCARCRELINRTDRWISTMTTSIERCTWARRTLGVIGQLRRGEFGG